MTKAPGTVPAEVSDRRAPGRERAPEPFLPKPFRCVSRVSWNPRARFLARLGRCGPRPELRERTTQDLVESNDWVWRVCRPGRTLASDEGDDAAPGSAPGAVSRPRRVDGSTQHPDGCSFARGPHPGTSVEKPRLTCSVGPGRLRSR